MKSDASETFPLKPIGYLVLVSIFSGCVLGPHLFNALTALGRSSSNFEGLRELSLVSVVSRIVLITMVLGLYPCLRAIGRSNIAIIYKDTQRGGLSVLLRGVGLGCLSMAVLFAVGLAVGAYRFSPDPEFFSVLEWLEILIGAFLVGWIEEFLIRGLIFRSFRARFAFLPTAIGLSALFAALHFIQPEPVIDEVYAHWASGFALLSHAFYGGHALHHYYPFALNLFLMGFVLCTVVERFGLLRMCIGLHAGWVLTMRLGTLSLERVDSTYVGLFGHSALPGKTFSATIMLLLFLLAVSLWPCKNRE